MLNEVRSELQSPTSRIFEKKEDLLRYYAFIHIGKPHEKNRYGDSCRIQVNDAYISYKDVPRFIFMRLDVLDDSERPNLEVYLNADKDTPLALIDSIKTIVHAAYPDLKLYRTVRQANTGKIGKVKL
jgi:hypothetical protein